MYKKIIISLSLEHRYSEIAIRTARSLLNDDGEIIAVHVIEPLNDFARLHLSVKDIAKNQQTIESEISKRLDKHDDIESIILSGYPGREIPDYADKVGGDCIIVGSHKPGLEDYFLGSTSARVVRHARCAVHVIRDNLENKKSI